MKTKSELTIIQNTTSDGLYKWSFRILNITTIYIYICDRLGKRPEDPFVPQTQIGLGGGFFPQFLGPAAGLLGVGRTFGDCWLKGFSNHLGWFLLAS